MVNQRTIVNQAAQFVESLLTEKLSTDHQYHDIGHTFRVRDAAVQLANEMQCSSEEVEILELACLFHDTGFTEVYEGHEACSRQIAERFLKEHAYPAEKQQRVLELIEVTFPPKYPDNLLERIIKDADLSNLGSKHFFDYLGKLRHEWSVFLNRDYDDESWVRMNYKFINNHQFFTPAAVEAYREQWKANRKQLKKMRTDKGVKKKEKKKAAASPGGIIAGNKSAQMMFKTSLRNHLDLAALADNKANIMLSVNALIITIVIPLAVSYISAGRGYLLVPVVILLLTCLFSMISATLATRPIRMEGYTAKEEINKGTSNLFFFGNFYKMKFNDYKDGMLKVLTEENKLDESAMRDLFYLGNSLGRKYYQLRLCYNLFMWGIILTVTTFIVTYSITM